MRFTAFGQNFFLFLLNLLPGFLSDPLPYAFLPLWDGEEETQTRLHASLVVPGAAPAHDLASWGALPQAAELLNRLLGRILSGLCDFKKGPS